LSSSVMEDSFIHSSTDYNTVAAGRACVFGFVFGAAGLGVAVSASGSATVQLDSVAATSDAVALAGAVAGLAGRGVVAHAGGGRGRRGSAAVGDGGAYG
jgi:hypothetical protein